MNTESRKVAVAWLNFWSPRMLDASDGVHVRVLTQSGGINYYYRPGDIAVFQALEEHNMNGANIYFTPNTFLAPPGSAKLVDIERINCFYVDIDGCDKESKYEEIMNLPIKPAFVVETRRGFHVYYLIDVPVVTPAIQEKWGVIHKLLIAKLNGDPKAVSLARILRVPGFNCMKADPHEIIIRSHDDIEGKIAFGIPAITIQYPSMSEFQARMKLEPPPEPDREILLIHAPRTEYLTKHEEKFFEQVHAIPIQQALESYSGTAPVNCEQFSFYGHAETGRLNMRVNNKGISAFIDLRENTIMVPEGTIGSPNITQWLRYYGHGYKEIYNFHRQYLSNFISLKPPTDGRSNPRSSSRKPRSKRRTFKTQSFDIL